MRNTLLFGRGLVSRGTGAAVVNDISEKCMAVGVPARASNALKKAEATAGSDLTLDIHRQKGLRVRAIAWRLSLR